MKTAEAYAQDIRNTPPEHKSRKVHDVFLAIAFLEVRELMAMRHSSSNETLKDILDEQDRKWRLIARLTPSWVRYKK